MTRMRKARTPGGQAARQRKANRTTAAATGASAPRGANGRPAPVRRQPGSNDAYRTPTAQERAEHDRNARPRRSPVRHAVEVDEERENAGRREDTVAFILDARHAGDDLAEQLGEAYVLSATSGDEAEENIRDEQVPEEEGGPFVETSARTEFGYDVDASNPVGAERSPIPYVSPMKKRPGR